MSSENVRSRHARPSRRVITPRRARRVAFTATAAVLMVSVLPMLARFGPDSDGSTSVAQAAPLADGPGLPTAPQTSQQAVALGDGTTLAAWKLVDGFKVFDLVLAPKKHVTEPGKVKDGLSVNGSIPAPTIRVNQGDKLKLNVINKMKEGTSIHWHGMDLPNEQDGVPGITQKTIPPKGQKTYEWTAISTGTHWYHSHMHGDQEGRGVFGLLDIVPAVADIASDRDYTMIFSDGALGFVINGKSFPATTRMAARVGERVRIRLIGAGPELLHSVHLHLGFFEVVAQDGNLLPQPYKADTVVLGIGQTFDLIWVPTRTGAWMIHCHIFSHSETKAGMTGMATLFDVAPANALTVPRIPINVPATGAAAGAASREHHS